MESGMVHYSFIIGLYWSNSGTFKKTIWHLGLRQISLHVDFTKKATSFWLLWIRFEWNLRLTWEEDLLHNYRPPVTDSHKTLNSKFIPSSFIPFCPTFTYTTNGNADISVMCSVLAFLKIKRWKCITCQLVQHNIPRGFVLNCGQWPLCTEGTEVLRQAHICMDSKIWLVAPITLFHALTFRFYMNNLIKFPPITSP